MCYCTGVLLDTEATDVLMRPDKRPALGEVGMVICLAPGVNEGFPVVLFPVVLDVWLLPIRCAMLSRRVCPGS